MTVYCEDSDLYDFGIAAGSIPNPGRRIASADASTNALTLDQHGFALNQPVRFRAEASGVLPAPLVAGTEYYVIPLSESAFSVAAAADGAAIDLTSAGSRTLVIGRAPTAAAREWSSRLIDDMLPQHIVPLVAPFPRIIVMTCAELAAFKLGGRVGTVSKTLTEIADAARKRLERWASGVPLRGEDAPEPAGLAVSASVPYADPRGWNRFGGL